MPDEHPTKQVEKPTKEEINHAEIMSQFKSLNKRLDGQEERITNNELQVAKLWEFENRVSRTSTRVKEIDSRTTITDTEQDNRLDTLEKKIDDVHTELKNRWSIGVKKNLKWLFLEPQGRNAIKNWFIVLGVAAGVAKQFGLIK